MTHKGSNRSVEDIKASGICKLSGEGTRLVPLGYVSLFQKAKAGKIRTFGRPLSCEVEHLQDQYRKGFPLIKEEKVA
jgi:hypothetical protein